LCIIKYEGYIKRQLEEIEKYRRNEDTALPSDMDYDSIKALSSEIKFDNLLLVVLTVLIMNIRDLVRPIPRLPAHHWLESRWFLNAQV
jgi:hypothetical protein